MASYAFLSMLASFAFLFSTIPKSDHHRTALICTALLFTPAVCYVIHDLVAPFCYFVVEIEVSLPSLILPELALPTFWIPDLRPLVDPVVNLLLFVFTFCISFPGWRTRGGEPGAGLDQIVGGWPLEESLGGDEPAPVDGTPTSETTTDETSTPERPPVSGVPTTKSPTMPNAPTRRERQTSSTAPVAASFRKTLYSAAPATTSPSSESGDDVHTVPRTPSTASTAPVRPHDAASSTAHVAASSRKMPDSAVPAPTTPRRASNDDVYTALRTVRGPAGELRTTSRAQRRLAGPVRFEGSSGSMTPVAADSRLRTHASSSRTTTTSHIRKNPRTKGLASLRNPREKGEWLPGSPQKDDTAPEDSKKPVGVVTNLETITEAASGEPSAPIALVSQDGDAAGVATHSTRSDDHLKVESSTAAATEERGPGYPMIPDVVVDEAASPMDLEPTEVPSVALQVADVPRAAVELPAALSDPDLMARLAALRAAAPAAPPAPPPMSEWMNSALETLASKHGHGELGEPMECESTADLVKTLERYTRQPVPSVSFASASMMNNPWALEAAAQMSQPESWTPVQRPSLDNAMEETPSVGLRDDSAMEDVVHEIIEREQDDGDNMDTSNDPAGGSHKQPPMDQPASATYALDRNNTMSDSPLEKTLPGLGMLPVPAISRTSPPPSFSPLQSPLAPSFPDTTRLSVTGRQQRLQTPNTVSSNMQSPQKPVESSLPPIPAQAARTAISEPRTLLAPAPAISNVFQPSKRPGTFGTSQPVESKYKTSKGTPILRPFPRPQKNLPQQPRKSDPVVVTPKPPASNVPAKQAGTSQSECSKP